MAMRWYLLLTTASFEQGVADSIRAPAGEPDLVRLVDQVVVPPAARAPRRDGNVRIFFPGYVLIHCDMTDELACSLRAIAHVAGFLESNNAPMPLTDAEADRIVGWHGGSTLQPAPAVGR